MKILFKISLLFSFISLVSFTQPDAQSYFDLGMKCISEKDYIKAIGEFTNAVSVRTNFSEAYLQRAKAKILLGNEMGFVNSEACADLVLALRYGNIGASDLLESNCMGECFDNKNAFQEPDIVYCADFSSKVFTEVPNDVLRLQNIVKFNLFNNKFIKIPEKLFSLYTLISLDLSSNNLTNISSNISKLSNLRELNFNKNKIAALPFEFGDLENLRFLNLRSNYIVEIPKSISKLKKLTVLDLSLNKINAVPLEIANLKNLKELNLVGNELSKDKRDLLTKLLPNTKIYFE